MGYFRKLFWMEINFDEENSLVTKMDRLAATRRENFIETRSHLRLHICQVAV